MNNGLNDNHYRILLYKQRCTKEELQNILLKNDMIIFAGRVYDIKIKYLGANIYEISKDIEKYKQDNGYIEKPKNRIVDKLKSVLCDPSGKVCIRGSNSDREILQEVISELLEPQGKGDV